MCPESTAKKLFVVLGDQLFPPSYLDEHRDAVVFMAENVGLCTNVRHHQQKIVLFLAAMRSHADELESAGFQVHYEKLDSEAAPTYEAQLSAAIDRYGCTEIVHFEIEDRPMEDLLRRVAEQRELKVTTLQSPGFTCSREDFAEFVTSREHLLMADFYKRQRRRLRNLVDDDGEPAGGRWSYDADNRKSLPRDVDVPDIPWPERSSHVDDVIATVRKHFPGHPGKADDFSWPSTRKQALAWLEQFIDDRLERFGPYEDALTRHSATVFHSALSPVMNLGLLTPDEIIKAVLDRSDDVPMQSVEGFVRQVIGWRDFVRGIYRHFDDRQSSSNFWSHERSLTREWYEGSTGIPPLDDVVCTARDLGWAHHIQRLMVVGNLMTLCEIHPKAAHRWFMEMFVDSAEWVMGPNVFGMALHSDGGIFATKPYICGSNYLLKMSDYEKGEWCDTVDGLYWRFIDRHQDYFSSQPRLSMMTATLSRMKQSRRTRIFDAAETFLEDFTAPPATDTSGNNSIHA